LGEGGQDALSLSGKEENECGEEMRLPMLPKIMKWAFYRGFAPGGLIALVGGLPNATAGICALRWAYLGRPGEPLR
jgi:hypothetical protein